MNHPTGRFIAGRYRLLRRLGSGGMGRVWLAYDEQLATEVAVKEIAVPAGVATGDLAGRVERARSEARNAARLRGHPHVVTVYDVFELDGLPWIVMEYVPGALDLEAVVRAEGPLPSTQVARIGRAVLDALTAGHAAGILHRDVKPANILLAPGSSGDSYEKILLTDYGISVRPEAGDPRVTAVGGIVGTPGYLAPERCRGGEPTAAADLFSLGATLYFAAEGKGPFSRADEYGTMAALLFEEPPTMTRASWQLAEVVFGLLRKEPERRPTAASALADLAALADSGRSQVPLPPAPGTPAPGMPPPADAPSRRLRRPFVAALVAFAVLLVGGGTWLGVWGPGDRDKGKTGSGSWSSSPVRDVDAGYAYGRTVSLTSELIAGQCVTANWSGKKFKSLPELVESTCEEDHDAQVMALVEADSHEEAREAGAGKCAGKLSRLRAGLPRATVYPLLPTRGTVEANSGRASVACLMFIDVGVLSGDLGAFRREGAELELGTAGTGDCFDVKTEEGNPDEAWFLIDCDKPHMQQTVGWVATPKGMSYEGWEGEVTPLCLNRFGSAWVRDQAHEIQAWYALEGEFDDGARFALCALSRVDQKQLPAGPAEPVTGT
ncbi:serine/threonine-protein kinase [Streptomyces sp. NBC_01304]|uniref:serine/threonine-protein kinase n=1 Tax=Streptomyces sp. NBC_01304 TaxID=2903818 RepID=UPI002E1574A3|nr:serine/threonine protein kinase [Streptomyces sp. NBC_01304]